MGLRSSCDKWRNRAAGFRADHELAPPAGSPELLVRQEKFKAYSYSQGWVEGALATAESTLQAFFGLKVPAWMAPKDYSLLPNPCPGFDDLEGCVKCKDVAKVLDSITPSCLKAVEEG